MRNQWRITNRRHISLLILSITTLGSIIYFGVFKMAQSDVVIKSFQMPQKVPSSKPDFSQQERAFRLHRGPEDYEIIAENNIFRPLGWKKEVRPPDTSTPTVAPEPIAEMPPTPPPTYALVLTGIAKSGSDWIAVVEDRERDEGAFLRRGEMLKDAQVLDIMSEHITLTRGETSVQLALGESIEYGIDGRMRFDTTGIAKMPEPSDETNTPSETQADSGGGGEQSLIERLRQRRQRELDQ